MFRVVTLPKADADVWNIVRYIHKRSPQGAAAWMNAYEKARKHLAEFAAGCGEADENADLNVEVKQSSAARWNMSIACRYRREAWCRFARKQYVQPSSGSSQIARS